MVWRDLNTYLHPLSVKLKNPATQLATNWPAATIKMFTETSLPLMLAGADSAIYIGIVIEDKPINIQHYGYQI